MALQFSSGRKPKTARAKRVLMAQQPKVHEEERSAIFMRGTTANTEITAVLRDLYLLKKPNGKFMERKSDKRPFEDDSSVEFMCVKNDASVFAFGSHSQKRPLNLTLGRMYDGHILDMFELGIKNVKHMQDFKGEKFSTGMKPCFVFQGDAFENDDELVQLKSLFLDFFSSTSVSSVNLAGLEHVVVLTAVDNKTVLFRHYRIVFKRSGLQTPRVQLEELGPSYDFVVRRSRLAADTLRKQAMRVPKGAMEQKKKNVERSTIGDRLGRVHMGKQEIDSMQLRKVKALKRKYDVEPDADAEDAEVAESAAAGESEERGSGKRQR